MNKFLFVFLALCFASAVFAADTVDINTATLEQLDIITGVGPVTAQKIIDARPFSSVDDLDRVSGIGPKTLEKIKDQGLACVNCLSEQTGETQVEEKSAPETQTIIYPSGIFINEILPSPSGADETDEFIEIFNSNGSEADLSGWILQDKTGSIASFEIKNKKIPARGFLIFYRPETKIMLNNETDGLSLLYPDGKIADSVDFTKALTGQSFNKTASGWQWSSLLTPGSANTIVAKITDNNAGALPKTKKSDKNNVVEAKDLTASLNQDNPPAGGQNPWFLFYTTLASVIICAAIVLIVKIKFSKTNVRT